MMSMMSAAIRGIRTNVLFVIKMRILAISIGFYHEFHEWTNDTNLFQFNIREIRSFVSFVISKPITLNKYDSSARCFQREVPKSRFFSIPLNRNRLNALTIPFVLLLLLLMSGTAAADVTYTDIIDVHADAISVRITETYTGNDAAIVKRDIANDRSAYVEQAEENLLAWSTSYLVIDDDPSLIVIREVDCEVTEVSGSYRINSTLDYEIAIPLDRSSADVACFQSNPCTAVRELMSRNRHSLWIQGHPAVTSRVIIIPLAMEMESIAGIGDAEIATLSDRVTITGVSATRKFLNGSRTTFEYATVVRISTKPIYLHPWFLSTLVMIEVALLGLWWMQRRR